MNLNNLINSFSIKEFSHKAHIVQKLFWGQAGPEEYVGQKKTMQKYTILMLSKPTLTINNKIAKAI